MDYIMAALTALLTFVSPCVLPLLPIFVTYFAAADTNEPDLEDGQEQPVVKKRKFFKTFSNTLAFCFGFSLFFIVLFGVLSLFSSFAIAEFVNDPVIKQKIYAVCGIILVVLGLKFMGVVNLPFLDKKIDIKTKTDDMNLINAFVLGLVFSLSMGSCAIALTSFSLMSTIFSANFFKGFTIGLVFTITLDVLFIICALLIEKLKGIFGFIKRNYNVINIIMGSLLVVLGILMALGFMETFTNWLS